MIDKNLLYELLKVPSPSGYELPIQKKVIELMKPYSDKVITHHNYTVVNVINPESKVKVLLCGHIDEIGLCINDINSDGTCKVERIGGIKPYVYIGQHVNVVKKDGSTVPGVIGYVPNLNKGGLDTSDLILDLGTDSKEETKQLVSIGDAVVFASEYRFLANNKLTGRALDDKLGAYICLEALKKVKAAKSTNGVYAATTVGEETTGRGAKMAADLVNPTMAIVVDVTFAVDVNYRDNPRGEARLGKGPVITVGSTMNDELHRLMLESIERQNLNYQVEVAPSSTYTDVDSIYHRQNGIPTYLISIPLRYMHSAVEVCDLQDIDDIINLIADVILHVDENTNFDPFK